MSVDNNDNNVLRRNDYRVGNVQGLRKLTTLEMGNAVPTRIGTLAQLRKGLRQMYDYCQRCRAC